MSIWIYCLGGSPRNSKFWHLVLDSFRKRLSRWKANNLSFGGRITLIKFQLTIDYLSLFKFLKEWQPRQKDHKNHFLLRGQEVSKPHLVNWTTVSRAKENRGLGLDCQQKYSPVGQIVVEISIRSSGSLVAVIWSNSRHASDNQDADQIPNSSHHSPQRGTSQVVHQIVIRLCNLIRFWMDSGRTLFLFGPVFLVFIVFLL